MFKRIVLFVLLSPFFYQAQTSPFLDSLLKTDLPQFANVLAPFVRRVVIDRTALTGTFDFRLSWRPEFARGGGGAPPPDAPAVPPVDPNGSSIFAALQEQLGLKLDAQQAPLEVIVIDAVDRPTPD